MLRFWSLFVRIFLAIAVARHARADLPVSLDAPYQIKYASNLTQGDSVVNITNTGANGNNLYGPGYGEPAGNICVNVYAFSPDEQMVACCSCLVTPNSLLHLSANTDIVGNTLTGIKPDSVVIKLVATATGSEPIPGFDGAPVPVRPTFDGSSCVNSAAQVGTDQHPVVSGLLAWGTTNHFASETPGPGPGPLAQIPVISETPFLPATLHGEELKSIASRCANIIGNGSTFGQCRSCRMGGLGGSKKVARIGSLCR